VSLKNDVSFEHYSVIAVNTRLNWAEKKDLAEARTTYSMQAAQVCPPFDRIEFRGGPVQGELEPALSD